MPLGMMADAHRHTDLWVLQKRGFMVNAASGAVAERVVSVDPGAPHHLLLPGLMNTQVRRVYQSTEDQVGEVVTEILKVDPGEAVYGQWGNRSLWYMENLGIYQIHRGTIV